MEMKDEIKKAATLLIVVLIILAAVYIVTEIMNSKGETTGPYWWHVAFGETPEKTLKRKMEETLGLSGVKPKLKRQYIREANNERELVYIFSMVSDENLPKNPETKDYIDLFAKD